MLDGWDKSKGDSIVRGIGTVVRKSATDRYCWPCCEGVAASAFLNVIEADPVYERSYRGIWNLIATQFIDHESGGCRAQIDDILRPTPGRSLAKSISTTLCEACLIPTLPTTGSATRCRVASSSRRANDVRNQHISVYHSLQCPEAELAP